MTDLNLTIEHFDRRVIARTNSIVRGESLDDLRERISAITTVEGVSAIALHGSDINKNEIITSEYPNIDFYFITTLLPSVDFETLRKLP